MFPATKSQTFFYPLIISCVFIFSTLYSQQSPGGEGLFIPYNNVTWIFAIIVICAGCFQVLIKKQVVLPRYWFAVAALPIGLLISGFIVGVFAPTQWFFRIGYVLAGFLFFISLFQFNLTRRQIENICFTLCGVAIIHSFIAYTQMSAWHLTSLIPQSTTNAPISIFQQVNVHASYLTTSFFIALFLSTSPSIRYRSMFLKALLLLCIFCTSHMLIQIGSRTTLVAFFISMPLIILARFSQFKALKTWSLLLLIAFIAGTTLGGSSSNGFERYETKLQRDTGHARTYIYDLSWQIFKQKPFFGYGLGSFERVFQEAKINYPEATKLGAVRYSHPHNELFFWLIESGIISLIGLLIAALATLTAVFQTSWKRACLYISLIFPISFHTQVELPFYHSAALWFLWLTLLYICHSHRVSKAKVSLSVAGNRFITFTTLSVSSLLIGFFLHSIISLFGVVDFMRSSKIKYASLEVSRNNLYFQEASQILFYTTILYQSIATGDKKYIEEYINWATSYLERTPATNTFNNLALAYAFMGNNEKAISVAQKAFSIYPANVEIELRLNEVKAKLPITQFKQKITTLESRKQAQAMEGNKNTKSQALLLLENE
jgi:O-antigen polymerase